MTNVMIRPFNGGFTREFDRVFGDFFRFPATRHDDETDFMPRVNIKDGKDNVSLTFELPGLDKKDIKVTVKDGTLTVSGEREFKSEEKDENCVRCEIRSGKFSRSFTLPETVNPDSITADYRNGILEIKLTKLEEVKPKEIEVKVS